ncbi:MAG: L-aspartate--glyoxylate aminotransferase BhcA [Pseudomonadota bacterium]
MSTQNPVFIPGPTNMPDRVRFAMAGQTLDHRAPGFPDFQQTLLDDLKKVFRTDAGRAITFPASGTGGWEAAITNTLSPGDTVLMARHGVFSGKWIELCGRHGLEVQVIDRPWGEAAPADALGAALAADTDHKIKAVLVTHNETATGVVSDIGAIRRAMDACAHPAMLFADCVSSLASMPFEMDAWGVDIAVTGSQKGFMLQTGMAIVAVSPKAFQAMETATCTRGFFDFQWMIENNDNGGYPYTPPMQLMQGLREALDMLLEEGLEDVFARHHRHAEAVRRAVAAWGLKTVAVSPDVASNTVTAIHLPEGFDSDALIGHAFNAYGVSYGAGLGQLQGRAFRIGHLGSLTEAMVLSGLATIEMAMADLAIPVRLGSGVAAAQAYYCAGGAKALQTAA